MTTVIELADQAANAFMRRDACMHHGNYDEAEDADVEGTLALYAALRAGGECMDGKRLEAFAEACLLEWGEPAPSEGYILAKSIQTIAMQQAKR